MPPLNFMEFRGFLSPASGFQSLQFRLIEIKLGLKSEKRRPCGGEPYTSQFNENEKKILKQKEGEKTLLECVERWLAQLPEIQTDFLSRYERAVNTYLESNRDNALSEADEAKRAHVEKEYETNQKNFQAIINERDYTVLYNAGDHTFSHKAMQGALFVSLYGNRAKYNQHFRIITLLREIDSLIMEWRFVHSGMVQRMIGSKVGTGGSGFWYLKSTVSEKYKIFHDLFIMSNYLLPKEYIPTLE